MGFPMTFCLGMKCGDGLLAIADTRITSGSEMSVAKKISVYQSEAHTMFVLTSGLRSVRDKAITYFDERLERDDSSLDKMFKAANALAEEMRKVRNEDGKWLAESGLSFDLYCILGGQLENDSEHRLFLIYPEGNWVEVRSGTPYVIIGESRYGKPLLDRLWRYDCSRCETVCWPSTPRAPAPPTSTTRRTSSCTVTERTRCWNAASLVKICSRCRIAGCSRSARPRATPPVGGAAVRIAGEFTARLSDVRRGLVRPSRRGSLVEALKPLYAGRPRGVAGLDHYVVGRGERCEQIGMALVLGGGRA